MKWFLGIDGGGTKTAFTIGKSDGVPVESFSWSGCSYQSIGAEKVISLLQEGVQKLMRTVEAEVEDCGGCCIGLPCYGEIAAMDNILEERLREALSPIPLKIVNDVVVGWAGGLGGREGIHLVAGTGAIAVGCGVDGSMVRSGGWSEFFSDEGSCYWVGKEGMGLFSKEADGRQPKGELYHIVRKVYGLKEDYEFIEKVISDIAPYRDKVAAFQRYVLEAANAGDEAAQDLYKRAAKELAQAVCSVKRQLRWSEETVKVSYAGGLFHAGEWILKPLVEELEAVGCIVCEPILSPSEGALLLAINEFKGN